MPLPIKTLSVLPNPWAAIDHQGRPSGVVLCDPVEHVPTRGDEPRRFVGATMAARMLREFPPGDPRSNEQDTTWTFVTEPVALPNTGYYRERIRSGELIAADSKTSRVAGQKNFVPPATALADARTAAIANWERDVGTPGAFAMLEAERAAAAPQPEPPKAEPKRKGGE